MKTKEETLELFEANQKLVHYVLNKYIGPQSIEDAEDLIQEGMIALYKCIKLYDETKGFAFSTYACSAILKSMVRHKERYLNKHSNIRSLNEVVQKDEKCEFIELIEDKNIDPTEIEVNELINNIYKITNEKERKTLEMRLEGKTQREIAKALKVSQVEISRVCKRIRKITVCASNGEIISIEDKRPRVQQIKAEKLRIKVRELREQGFSYRQIAERLHIPVGSVGSYLRAS